MAESLPFRDKSFDFIIASHVLEHSTSPERFLDELQRVGRAGYIEVPDALMERLNPYRDHRLEITTREGRLVIRKKPGWQADAELVELYEDRAKPLITRELIPNHPFHFHVRHYWESTIAFTVLNPQTDANWSPPLEDLPRHVGVNGMRVTVLDGLRSLLSQRRRNSGINLVSLLQCPSCRQGSLEEHSRQLVCASCQAAYEIKNGIPRLHPKGAH